MSRPASQRSPRESFVKYAAGAVAGVVGLGFLAYTGHALSSQQALILQMQQQL